MFCPKCGTENPEEGKFCRKCGTGIGVVSEALTGNLQKPAELVDRKGRPIGWESAIGKFFTGLAFLLVACILGYTGMAGGKTWWFWMLIPAFSMIGAGIAHIMKIKQAERMALAGATPKQQNAINAAPNMALPNPQTEFVKPASIYDTGEFAVRPPSVTEGTTRHLEINTEGETMTLPKK